ncbi:UDP-glucose 4-epimerase GalE [Candidatus Microgenomates bacterium]|nr:UDP-glucose 4-epimerase GalE [Candidatus Microgenomates bacterium]
MKILITGAGGYIGSNTAKVFLQAGYSVVALDNFSNGFKAPLELLQKEFGQEKLVIYTDDLVDDGGASVMDREPDIQGIVHFAALLNVGESMQIPEKYFTNNVIGTQKLLHAAIDHHIPYFLFSSSCTVYGEIDNPPVDESFPVKDASSAYGATKQLCESMLHWYDKLGKIKYISLRYFNVCGASDDSTLGDAKRETFGLMQNAVKGALGMREFDFNYQKVNTPDGSPIRDFINVVDLADAHVKGLEYVMKNDTSEVFNLGTGTGNSVLEIVNEIKRVLGVDFPVKDAQNRRTGEIPQIYADYSKAKRLLEWEPKRSLEQSIKTLAQFYKDHPHGWE